MESHSANSHEDRYLVALRRDLHRLAEPSAEESRTAARLVEELALLETDSIREGLGGFGVAVTIEGAEQGPAVLLRTDIDALPIDETRMLEHTSSTPGVAHKCGHDGHMAMAIGVARSFARRPPARGRLTVLFQPSEENGKGAARVIADSSFTPLRPDIALAVHNLPGFDLGQVVVRAGTFACASRGITIDLSGTTSHAAEPEQGRSPVLAVAQVIEAWTGARQLFTGLEDSAQATVIHATLGRPSFGTSPGDGSVMATLRARSDETIDKLEDKLRFVAEGIALSYGLKSSFSICEPFPATINDPCVVSVVTETARNLNLDLYEPDTPFPWSEDFGHFGSICPSALIGLGAGTTTPVLHHPDYDFPDELIPKGVSFIIAVLRHWLGFDD